MAPEASIAHLLANFGLPANIEADDVLGWAPLVSMLVSDKLDAAKVLPDKGVDVETRGKTAAHLCMFLRWIGGTAKHNGGCKESQELGSFCGFKGPTTESAVALRCKRG